MGNAPYRAILIFPPSIQISLQRLSAALRNFAVVFRSLIILAKKIKKRMRNAPYIEIMVFPPSETQTVSFRKLCQTSCGRRCWGLLLQPKFLKVKRTSETCLWRAWVSSSHLQVLWPLNSTVVQHMDTSTCIHIFPHNHYRQGWASRLVPRYFFHFFVQVALLNE